MSDEPKVTNAIVSVARAFVPSTNDKKWWQSKTLWTAAIIAGAGFLPPVQAVAIANPAIAGVIVSGIFAILRIVSGGKITAS